jgi:hypothetical protein
MILYLALNLGVMTLQKKNLGTPCLQILRIRFFPSLSTIVHLTPLKQELEQRINEFYASMKALWDQLAFFKLE